MTDFENMEAVELNEEELKAAAGGKYKPLPQKEGYAQYIIQPGDTLTKIAKMFNTTVNMLLSINPQIRDRNLIRAGAYMYIKL